MKELENVDKTPLVAIQCTAYNHESYIREALDGFVMQQTDFPFVAIVHDDASTDGTAAIIQEYAEKYPNIIKPIYETENQYSKKNGSLTRIMRNACEATGAKYIALCEGDDYWTDPLKLQKQVDFLEAHPDYSMCFANAIEQWEDGREINHQYASVLDKDYTGIEIFEPWIIATMSVVIRTDVYQSELYQKCRRLKGVHVGDVQVFLSAAAVGKLRGMSDIVGVYRRIDTGASMALRKHYLHLCSLINISKIFGPEYLRVCKQKFRIFYFSTLKDTIQGKGDWRFVVRYTWLAPKLSLREIYCWTVKSVKSKFG